MRGIRLLLFVGMIGGFASGIAQLVTGSHHVAPCVHAPAARLPAAAGEPER